MTALNDKRASWVYLATASIAIVAFTAMQSWLAFTFLRPTPATDPEGSYREFFARNGIDLELVPLTGAAESLARLQDPKSDGSNAGTNLVGESKTRICKINRVMPGPDRFVSRARPVRNTLPTLR